MVDRYIIDEISKLEPKTERVAKRVDVVYRSKPQVCVERPLLINESWKETEGEPVSIRWAKAFEKVLGGIPIVLLEDHLPRRVEPEVRHAQHLVLAAGIVALQAHLHDPPQVHVLSGNDRRLELKGAGAQRLRAVDHVVL